MPRDTFGNGPNQVEVDVNIPRGAVTVQGETAWEYLQKSQTVKIDQDTPGTTNAVAIYGKTGDATYQVPRLDPTTHVLGCIDHVCNKIHDGDYFSYVSAQDLTNAQTISFVLVTPNTTRWSHFGFELSGEAEFSLDMYVNATPAANGTEPSAPAVINNNQNSATTPTLLIYGGPTLGGGSKGTIVKKWHGGSAKAAGGIAGTATEIVLKQNTKYWFDVTNETASNNFVSWLVGWYEHENRAA